MTAARVRHALPSDQAWLEEMLYQSLYVPQGEQPFPRTIITLPDLAKYVEDWGKPGNIALIAFGLRDGSPIGAVWLRLLRGLQRGYGYVDDETPEVGIAVAADFRGQGIGVLLLQRFFEEAKSSYKAVSLSVSKGNAAHKLYRRVGFEQVSEDDTSITMVKRLSLN